MGGRFSPTLHLIFSSFAFVGNTEHNGAFIPRYLVVFPKLKQSCKKSPELQPAFLLPVVSWFSRFLRHLWTSLRTLLLHVVDQRLFLQEVQMSDGPPHAQVAVAD